MEFVQQKKAKGYVNRIEEEQNWDGYLSMVPSVRSPPFPEFGWPGLRVPAPQKPPPNCSCPQNMRVIIFCRYDHSLSWIMKDRVLPPGPESSMYREAIVSTVTVSIGSSLTRVEYAASESNAGRLIGVRGEWYL